MSSGPKVHLHLPDEILLRIFALLDDSGLLSLATISRHVHELVLLLHLERHGVSLADIEAGEVPRQGFADSAALKSLVLARFLSSANVNGISLKLRFTQSNIETLEQELGALARLCHRLRKNAPGIISVSLELHLHLGLSIWRAVGVSSRLAELIILHGASPERPLLCVGSSFIRSSPRLERRDPTLVPALRLLTMPIGNKLRVLRSYQNNLPLPLQNVWFTQIQDDLFALLQRGPAQSYGQHNAIVSFDLIPQSGCDSLSAICVVDAANITQFCPARDLGVPPHLVSAHFKKLNLPSLDLVRLAFSEADSALDAALAEFLGRHPSIAVLRLYGPAKVAGRDLSEPVTPMRSLPWRNMVHQVKTTAKALLSPRILSLSTAVPPKLPPHSLPLVEHLFSNVRFAAWLLAPDSNALENLTAVTLGMQSLSHPEARMAYTSVLNGISSRPRIRSLALKVGSWAPWKTSTSANPELGLSHVNELHLAFRSASVNHGPVPPSSGKHFKQFVAWLKLFPPVQVDTPNDGRVLTMWDLAPENEEQLVNEVRKAVRDQNMNWSQINSDMYPPHDVVY